MKKLPPHIAAKICGHTVVVAQKHYWTVQDSDLDVALEVFPSSAPDGTANGSTDKKVTQNKAQYCSTKQGKNRVLQLREPCEIQGLFSFLLDEPMGEEGLEPPTSTL